MATFNSLFMFIPYFYLLYLFLFLFIFIYFLFVYYFIFIYFWIFLTVDPPPVAYEQACVVLTLGPGYVYPARKKYVVFPRADSSFVIGLRSLCFLRAISIKCVSISSISF